MASRSVKTCPLKKFRIDVVNPGFHFAFVLRSSWTIRGDDKTVVLRQAAVGFSQHRIVQIALQYTGFQIIEYPPVVPHRQTRQRHAHGTPARSRSADCKQIQCTDGGTSTASSQIPRPGDACPPAHSQSKTGTAKIHLGFLAWGRLHTANRLWKPGMNPLDKPPQRRITSRIPMLFCQTMPDGFHLHLRLHQGLHELRIRLYRAPFVVRGGWGWQNPSQFPPAKAKSLPVSGIHD